MNDRLVSERIANRGYIPTVHPPSRRPNMREEQALTDRFERLCGSIERAQRMLRP